MEVLEYTHQCLLRCGFQYVLARTLPEGSPLRLLSKAIGFYVKDYNTPEGVFKIGLRLTEDPFTSLPTACVLRMPEQFCGLLMPHINMGWYLCYVQEKEADWDVTDLQGIFTNIDHQISVTIDKSLRSITDGGVADTEMEGEFSAYWLPEKKAYLLSQAPQEKKLSCYVAIPGKETSLGRSEKYEEWIVCDESTSTERDAWLTQRALKLRDMKSIVAGYIRIKPARLAGIMWPPESFKDLLGWLAVVDNVARQHVIEHLIKNPVKRHFLLLDVVKQDMVGIYFELNTQAVALNSYTSPKKRKANIKARSGFGNLATALGSKTAVNAFCRTDVIKADSHSVLRRNRRGPLAGDLSSRSIALVGCGTIGGYLAGLLARAGAGCGSKKFDLFDGDTFSPYNYGRHALTTADFGNNKAVSLAHSLNSSSHLARSINAIPFEFPLKEETLQRYDIVIDATGRPPVSKRLAVVVRQMQASSRPVLIHGFNDGNGRAAKVIIDDGTCCYGCLLANVTLYKDGVDLRFQGIDHDSERHISCGSTFTPYDAAVSLMTAAMMQEAALSLLEPIKKWTYNEHVLDGGRSRRPQYLPRIAKCETCHGRI